MRKLFALGLLCLFIAGCDYNAWNVIEEETSFLKGQHIDMAINKLGYPESEGHVVGEKYYKWEVERVVSDGGSISSYNNPYGYTSFLYIPPEKHDHNCNIRIFVDNNDIIQNYDLDGSHAACEIIARRLEG